MGAFKRNGVAEENSDSYSLRETDKRLSRLRSNARRDNWELRAGKSYFFVIKYNCIKNIIVGIFFSFFKSDSLFRFFSG